VLPPLLLLLLLQPPLLTIRGSSWGVTSAGSCEAAFAQVGIGCIEL